MGNLLFRPGHTQSTAQQVRSCKTCYAAGGKSSDDSGDIIKASEELRTGRNINIVPNISSSACDVLARLSAHAHSSGKSCRVDSVRAVTEGRGEHPKKNRPNFSTSEGYHSKLNRPPAGLNDKRGTQGYESHWPSTKYICTASSLRW